VILGLIGRTLYYGEADIIADIRGQGEQSGKLMAELAVRYVQTSDISSLQSLAKHFMQASDARK